MESVGEIITKLDSIIENPGQFMSQSGVVSYFEIQKWQLVNGSIAYEEAATNHGASKSSRRHDNATFSNPTAGPSPQLVSIPTQELIETTRVNSKTLYDSVTSLEKFNKQTALDSSIPVLNELYIKGFDSEQVWQQIDHRLNIQTETECVKTLSKLLVDTHLSLNIDTSGQTNESQAHTDSDSNSSQQENDDDDDEDEDMDEVVDCNDDVLLSDTEQANNEKVDDRFFSFNAMEKFLDQQDALLEQDPVKFDRQFDELYESDDEKDPGYKYDDLFNKQSKSDDLPTRSMRFDDDDNNGADDEVSDDDLELMKALDEETSKANGDEDGMSDDEEADVQDDDMMDGSNDSGDEELDSDAEHLEDVIGKKKFEPAKSEYEKRTEKLRDRIAAMEDDALEDKPWQLMGEVTAKTRPENSLIQEHLEFDSNVAPVPVITMETTLNLEQLIIQRIKDKAFDDVERKTRLREDGDRFKKRIDLDHEKSKHSLSQIYEQEYLKLRDKEDEDEKEEEDPQEKEIKSMMTSLFSKLDALSSFQYTPKPAPKEVQIISHLPAVVVEEVQPATMADTGRLAPEEIKKPKIEVKDRSEMDTTDKKRLRRHMKAKARKKEQFKKTIESRVQKINPGLGNKRAEQRSIEAIKQAVVNEGKLIKPTRESVISEKTYSSSKEFFKALQNEVKLDKQTSQKKANSKKWVIQKSSKPAEKFKL